jgi:tRNA(Arg) A34 adenosine deaminase TadA
MNRKDLNRCLDITAREYSRHKAESFRHWAFIFQDNELKDWGRNTPQSSDWIRRFGYNPTDRHWFHAEVMAVRKCRGLLDFRRPWTCVNIRLDNDGKPRLSCPCPLCFNFIKSLGCNKVWFTTQTGWAKQSI